MGLGRWYEAHVLPHAIGAVCGSSRIGRYRAKVVPLAEGAVLELGCGGGFNQALYDPARVTRFAGIDPNAALLERARATAAAIGWESDIREGVGEAIPFHDGAFDSIVCTFTLCSVQNHARVLAELRRVLKPGGRLLYLEHGRAPDPGPAHWQDRLEQLWKPLAGGCHLTRPVGDALRRADFVVEPLGREYFPGAPRWAGWLEWGSARRMGA